MKQEELGTSDAAVFHPHAQVPSSLSSFVQQNLSSRQDTRQTRISSNENTTTVYFDDPYKPGDSPAKPDKQVFQLGADKFEFVDSKGEVPFGEPVTPDSKAKLHGKYLSTTVGIKVHAHGGIEEEVLNVNINDQLTIAGHSIRDGQPHRHIFKINAQGKSTDERYRWIDATLFYGKDRQEYLTINAMSRAATEPQPGDGAQWDVPDQTSNTLELNHQENPQHANCDRFWSLMDHYRDVTAKDQSAGWFHNYYLMDLNHGEKK